MDNTYRIRQAKVILLALQLQLLLIPGCLASYSNGNSRYQQFQGCNGTTAAAIPEAISQEDEHSPILPPPAPVAVTNYANGNANPMQDHNNKITTPNYYPSNSYFRPSILNSLQQNYYSSFGNNHHNYNYNNNELTEDRVPTLNPIMANRFAQLHKSVTAYRNQLTGNRFFDMEDDSVKFSLYTRKNPASGQTIKLYNKDLLEKSDFSADKPTKLIIHGFSEIGVLGEWVSNLRDAYLSTSEANVIIADFSTFETFLLFWTNLPIFASKRIADLITFLELTAPGTSRENFHLIARSWGTHVVGVAGRILQGRVGRITGLEPEARVYGSVLPDYRLMAKDAQFVDIVRVNGRRYFFHGSRFGLTQPTGHVDIYPNFFERGAGCTGTNSYGRPSSGAGAYCHKGRGVSYFIESIKYPQSHQMCQCRSYIDYKSGNCYCHPGNSNFYMGEYLTNQTRGVFQLTNSPSNSNPLRKHYLYH